MNFLGTLDAQPLELRANGMRAMRFEPTATSPNLIGGYAGNTVAPGMDAAVIGGGGRLGAENRAGAELTFVGGGWANTNSGGGSFLGGGFLNTIQEVAYDAVLAGGRKNTIESYSPFATISGGSSNWIQFNGAGATISGGSSNWILFNARGATIGGGTGNTIQNENLYPTIGGGWGNGIESYSHVATIGGGLSNVVQGANGGTIGGGRYNAVAAMSGTIGGGEGNYIAPSANNATISGGKALTIEAGAIYATIGGGGSSHIEQGATYSTIGGGVNGIRKNASYSTIAGGSQNLIGTNSQNSTIGGGYHNVVEDGCESAAIAGGYGNFAEGPFAILPGGHFNNATNYALAAGRRAKARHTGAFVWADSQDMEFGSAAPNQFCIRANGGVQLDNATSIFCGSQTRQMLNLFGTSYGIGVQANTTYFRSHNNFNWYKDGVHADGEFDLGGAQLLMRLTPGALFVETADTWMKEVYADRLSAESIGSAPQGSFIQMSSSDFARLRLGVAGFPKWDMAAEPSATPELRFWNGSANVAWLTYSGVLYAQSFQYTSDRDTKENFTPANVSEVLEQVVSLPITRWNFKNDTTAAHLGPMAQDFHAAFQLGSDDKSIAIGDAQGVALAAIQGLNQKLEDERRSLRAELQAKDAEISSLRADLEELRRLVRESLRAETR